MLKNDNAFISEAKQVIQELGFYIEQIDYEDILGIDFLDEVLVIDTPSGQFVLNYNSPLRQIWLSSPISGPHHFSYMNKYWINKHEQNLKTLLYKELESILKAN
jgi:iron donor protein CyaY